METTLTLQQPTTETTERLLIYSADQEIGRITQETQTRLSILTRIFQHKIKSHQIAGITNTPFAIGQYVFELQLKENSKLKELHDAGIKSEATLPTHLQRLKDDLMSWHNYKGHPTQDKFAFLEVEEGSAEIDSEQLENYFVQRQLKVYLSGERLVEFRELQKLCDILSKYGMPSNQVRESSVLWGLIEPVGRNRYVPRWTWFNRERN